MTILYASLRECEWVHSAILNLIGLVHTAANAPDALHCFRVQLHIFWYAYLIHK